MSDPREILNRVRIAAPCPASWEIMEGDERARFCALCKLNVYNLSDMSTKEAAKLVSEAEGRLCVRFYQRRDGTVMTRNCPVGVRAIRKRLASTLACLFVLFAAGIAYASNLSRSSGTRESPRSILAEAKNRIRHVEPFKTVLDLIDPPQVVGAMPAPVPGMMVLMPPRTSGRSQSHAIEP